MSWLLSQRVEQHQAWSSEGCQVTGPVQSVQRCGTGEEKSGGHHRPGEPSLLRTVPNPSLCGWAPHFYSQDPILLPEICYYSPAPLSFPMVLAQTELGYGKHIYLAPNILPNRHSAVN